MSLLKGGKITSVRVGFGATLMAPQPGGTVKKYYFEPEIELQEPAICESEEDLQETLKQLGVEALTLVQNSVREKIIQDKVKNKKDSANDG